MVKTSKRAKKFSAKGGAKGMLEKGTITKKGKLKHKRSHRTSEQDAQAKAASKAIQDLKRKRFEAEEGKKRDEEDFVGESNLGDVNMEDFLKSVVDEEDDMIVDDYDDNDGNDDDIMDGQDDSDGEASGSEDSDDDDLEAAEERMKAEMSKLAESDPDFHKYLEENESSLLQFSGDKEAEDDDDDNDDDMQQGDEDMEERPKKAKDNSVIVNAKVLETYEHGAFRSHGVKALKRLMAAYKSACHMADAQNPDEDSTGRLKEANPSKRSFHIESSTVFDRLIVVCLKNCHEEFRYHLIGNGAVPEFEEDDEDEDSTSSAKEDGDGAESDLNKPINPRQMAKSTRWEQLKGSINSFIKATLHLMSEAKEAKLLTFILKSLANYLPFLSAFPKLGLAMLKNFTSLWSSTSDDSPEYQSVRLNAFLRIRQLALTQPFPFIEQCLKATYLAYAKSAKFANAATVSSLLPTLTFMGNCVVELYSLDYASSYQHSFIYIRQLALHLRTAIQKKTPEAFRVVYCWQYMHCLKLWTAVIASSCSNSKESSGGSSSSSEEANLMRSLCYPLVEMIFGVARLIPTTRHLPLRLHCVRNLQQLAALSETYIPTTSLLLDIFDLREISMTPKRVKTRGNDIRGVRLPIILKLPKQDALRTAEQLDVCLAEVFLLLNREIDLYRYSAGFPEFTIRIIQRLRKFSKETKNGKFRAYARGCIELCEKHALSATEARTTLTEAPKDIKRLEVLKPNNVLTMGERYEAAIAKEKPLETATQPELPESTKALTKKKNKSKNGEESEQPQHKGADKKKKAKNLKANEKDLKNIAVLKEEDEVQEGIDWSDSESDSE